MSKTWSVLGIDCCGSFPTAAVDLIDSTSYQMLYGNSRHYVTCSSQTHSPYFAPIAQVMCLISHRLHG